MHTFFHKLNNQNIFPTDPMDSMLVNRIVIPYYKNEEPYALDGNFATAWKTLAQYFSPYKYFKLSESTGGGHIIADLKPEFVALLDKARDIARIPFKLTSGYRTPSENALVGGVQDSSHETGLAADILVTNSINGGIILLALAKVGFTRFGFYNDGHIHVDMDLSKPNPCYWVK